MTAPKSGTAETREPRPSENLEKLRAVTLAIARTPVKFREGCVMEMYRRMATNALDNTKGANEVTDTWSKAYDKMLERFAAEEQTTRSAR